MQITPQISESATMSTVTASITASPITTQKTQKRAAIQRKRNTSIPEDLENSLQLPSTPFSGKNGLLIANCSKLAWSMYLGFKYFL